jgi:hypothetical protein
MAASRRPLSDIITALAAVAFLFLRGVLRSTRSAEVVADTKHHQIAERDFWVKQIRIAKWLNWITAVGAVAGVIVLLFVWQSLRVAKRAADDGAIAARAARDQSIASVEANRPWIKPKVTPNYIEIGADRITVSILVSSDNIGKSPAENLVEAVAILPTDDPTKMKEQQQEVCDKAKADYPNPIKRLGVGNVVFPNDTSRMGINTTITPESIREARRAMLHGIFGDSDKSTIFGVAGCVLYRFTGSTETHQTSVLARCGKNIEGAIGAIDRLDIREKGKLGATDLLCMPPYSSSVVISAD